VGAGLGSRAAIMVWSARQSGQLVGTWAGAGEGSWTGAGRQAGTGTGRQVPGAIAAS